VERLEVDSTRDMMRGAFDPLRTPYEVDQQAFPLHGTSEEQFTHLLGYAILAPSSYNAQPWKFKLYDQGIAVYADYARRLPISDPNNRELLMGVGTAIMNLRIAAQHFGFEVDISYNFDNENDRPLAFVSLTRMRPQQQVDETVEKLFYSITRRHTNRHPFLMARVPEAVLQRLQEFKGANDVSVFLSTNSQKNTEVARLVAEAERVQQADFNFRKELAAWLRPNKTQKFDGMTGAAFGISDVGSTLAPWAMRTMDLGGVRARYDERLCVEAPALCVLYGEDTISTWVAVGEVLQTILLALTRDGLQFSFFNMPIKVSGARLELRKILGLSALPQLLLRIGYSLEKTVPTPRRPVEDCIVSSL
jgi:hypothetical protein